VGSQRALWGPETAIPSLCNVYILLNINFFSLQASGLAPLSTVYPQRWSLLQDLSGHGITNPASCLHHVFPSET